MKVNGNSIHINSGGIIMFVDMNSFFASCEQQMDRSLRGKPVGVCPYESPNAAVIAASLEAKALGIKTGMRLTECRIICPQLIIKSSQPVKYRHFHMAIMSVLKKYCGDVIPKSIDEAVMIFTSYKYIYKDFETIAKKIKADITEKADYLKCSIGLAPNAFLAKLASGLQKPDGYVEITKDNLDDHLKKLNLTDLPGIAFGNEKRLKASGIYTPLELRYAPVSLLRKALGGITGYYWHCRLNFYEVDLYSSAVTSMSAGRMVSAEQLRSSQTIDSLIISLCTRLEQRLVKQKIFCKTVSFVVRYRNDNSWKTQINLNYPLQDAIELRQYIMLRVTEYEQACSLKMFTKDVQHIDIGVHNFVSEKLVQYNLFDNRIQQDKLRKTMYNIKDKYGKNSVRKASETIEPDVMKDAIGFGSVKDLMNGEGDHFNNFLLEE